MGIFRKLGEETTYLSNILRILRYIKKHDPDAEITVADRLEEAVDKYVDNIALIDDDRVITFTQMEAEANRYAHWAQTNGIGRGDVVAVLMESRPEYVFACFGLNKVGAIAALINTNLTGGPLAHCVNISEARNIVLGAELADKLATGADQFNNSPRIWATGGEVQGSENLDIGLQEADTTRPARSFRAGMTGHDLAYYIYTSGTTGNPKAARITHHRWANASGLFAAGARVTPEDRMYLVLPLYHVAGGIVALGLTLRSGASTVIRRKFSASTFWQDVNRFDATLFQYIGELCRYLLNSPETAAEKSHRLRMVIGNGLRPDIWEAFQTRFNIPVIAEFYAATEGNFVLVNIGGQAGAIGRIPSYLSKLMPVKLVEFDLETESPVRDKNGRCIECDFGRAGEAICKIDPNDPKTKFEGYSDQAASEKKILRDVLEEGDSYFRSGDLMKKDENGYFYFVDRIGDTFRWKGENAATSEIAEILSVYPGIKEANVYGVDIQGMDGRAGMASIVADDSLDLEGLARHVEKELAVYARPVFLRLSPKMGTTSTFKHLKLDLVREGFHLEQIKDPVYFLDTETGSYIHLDRALYDGIIGGEVRV